LQTLGIKQAKLLHIETLAGCPEKAWVWRRIRGSVAGEPGWNREVVKAID